MEAASAEVLHALRRGWIIVWVVAVGTGEFVSAGALAGATQESFVLTGRATSVAVFVRAHEVDSEVGELVTRFELR